MGKRTVGLVLAGVLSFFEASAAQIPPAGDSASTQEARFREERLEPPRADRKEEPAPAPVIEDRVEPPAASPASAGVKVPVREIRFLGNYSISENELRPLMAGLVGRDVSLEEIQAGVSRVKKHYRDKGYVATYAFVPPQEIQDGILSVDVIEGRLGELRVEGARFYSNEWLRKQFAIKAGDVLTYNAIRTDLDRLNRTEDIKAKLALEAGKQIGTADAVVTVEDRYPIHLSADLNNSGTKNTGLYRFGIAARHNNVTGHGDSASFTTQLSSGVRALGAGYEAPLPLWDRRTRAGYQFSTADVSIGGAFKALEAEGRADTHSLYLRRPVFKKPGLTVDGTAGLDFKEVRNKLLGESSGQDDLRVLRFEADAEIEGSGDKAFLSGGIYTGIPGLFGGMADVDPRATRVGTGGEFFVARASGAYYRRLAAEYLLSIRGSAQATPDAVPSSEQFRLGGARSVRGYSESDTAADYGGQLTVELFLPTPFIPGDWRMPTGEVMREAIQAFVFVDGAWGGVRSTAPGENKHKSLAGAGAGVRVHLGKQFYARMEIGYPLGDEPSDNRDHAFYFTISYEFF